MTVPPASTQAKRPGSAAFRSVRSVEGPHADDHGVEAGEFFRREIGAGECPHGAAHLFKRLGDGIARARQVADVAGPDGQIKARHPRTGGRL